MAWKGRDNDNAIWWLRFIYSRDDAQSWEPQSQYGGLTSAGVALCGHNGRLYMVWKSAFDGHLWWDYYDGGWQGQKPIDQPWVTSHTPALASFNGSLYLAWKDEGSTEVRCAWFSDANGWQTVGALPEASTDAAPSLAAYRFPRDAPNLCVAWKVAGSLTPQYGILSSDNTFVLQPVQDGIGTTSGPALSVFSFDVFMAWKGDPTGLFWGPLIESPAYSARLTPLSIRNVSQS